jgi:hypothetical protein
MSLSFLVPAFLAGLLALAVPVVIHLTRRQTKDSLAFPSLMFLQRIPHQSSQRRTIDRWPLLLLRCAALALLVLAFARPLLQRGGETVLLAGGAGADREVVILLDRSYSMGYGDRWERALAAARELVDGLAPGDRASLLLFDSRPESLAESSMDPAVLRAALREARPGQRGTRYAPALRYGNRVLAGSPLARRELVLISDFQRVGWDADAAEIGSITLPPGATLVPVSVAGGAEPPNVAVAGVELRRSVAAGRERVGVTARLAGSADGPVPVTLELDGRAVETRSATLEPSGAATVEFAALTLPETGTVRGVVRTPDDALAADNAFHFVLSVDQRIPVVVVNGPGATAQASYFLERALAIGDAPGFRVEVRRAGELRAADLAARPVVILNQAPFPTGEVGERLRAMVEAGGGLVVALGDNPLGSWSGVLPASPGGAVDHLASGGTRLGFVDLGHPVFEAFRAPRSGDFSAARVFRYRPLAAGSAPRVLARYGDGGAALAEATAGEGRVLVWTSTLDAGWNDLALQPVFLPFLHRLVRYAAGYTPARSWLTVGDPYDPRSMLPLQAGFTVALTPGGEQVPLGEAGPIELGEAGFYELRDPRTGARGAVVAVNADRSESDLGAFDPQEMVSALRQGAGALPGAGGASELTLEQRERQQSGWWYLVVVAFLLLAAETALSNRWGRAAGPAAGPALAGPGGERRRGTERVA